MTIKRKNIDNALEGMRYIDDSLNNAAGLNKKAPLKESAESILRKKLGMKENVNISFDIKSESESAESIAPVAPTPVMQDYESEAYEDEVIEENWLTEAEDLLKEIEEEDFDMGEEEDFDMDEEEDFDGEGFSLSGSSSSSRDMDSEEDFDMDSEEEIEGEEISADYIDSLVDDLLIDDDEFLEEEMNSLLKEAEEDEEFDMDSEEDEEEFDMDNEEEETFSLTDEEDEEETPEAIVLRPGQEVLVSTEVAAMEDEEVENLTEGVDKKFMKNALKLAESVLAKFPVAKDAANLYEKPKVLKTEEISGTVKSTGSSSKKKYTPEGFEVLPLTDIKTPTNVKQTQTESVKKLRMKEEISNQKFQNYKLEKASDLLIEASSFSADTKKQIKESIMRAKTFKEVAATYKTIKESISASRFESKKINEAVSKRVGNSGVKKLIVENSNSESNEMDAQTRRIMFLAGEPGFENEYFG